MRALVARAMLGIGIVVLVLALVGGATAAWRLWDSTTPSHAVIDWVDFVRFDGISYAADRPGQQLSEADLGPELFRVRRTLANEVTDPGYREQDGDAAFLPRGTPVYAMDGYDPTFRLASRREGAIVLYEAHRNPRARVGGDVLDIAGKVETIDVLSDVDGTTRLASITDPPTVERLVDLVLSAPSDRSQRSEPQATRYFIAFRLRDGTFTRRVFWPETGILDAFLVPSAFREAVDRAVAERADRRPAGTPPPRPALTVP